MQIRYLGHASLAIQCGTHHLIIDPFISANNLAKHIDIDLLKADFILITHAHQDHILDVEKIAKRTEATIISNYEIVNHYTAKGFKGHPLNHGGSWDFGFAKITYVNAIHTSSFPDKSYGGQPGGFVIETTEANVYIAGDTALTYDMKLIPLQCTVDLAVFPIGDNFTMGIEGAAIAAEFVECDRILGVHYDTFEMIEIDHDKAKQTFKSQQKELILLDIGDSLDV